MANEQEITLEKSKEQAEIITPIQLMILQLDVPYLQQALASLRARHSFSESAMILNPRPLTAMPLHDLMSAKIKQLELYIQIAMNAQDIMKCERDVMIANNRSEQIEKLFQ